jgi:carbamoyl-phosphate synthase large subunit
VARTLHELGFKLTATKGTASAIAADGLPVTAINKVQEGRPHVVDLLKNGEISLVVNSVEERRGAIQDSRAIRTTRLGAARDLLHHHWPARVRLWKACVPLQEQLVYSLQELHAGLRQPT